MASRLVIDLSPVFQPRANAFLAALTESSIDHVISCTLRSLAEQGQLYAQGRTTPGKIVTNAKPGSSAHNYGLAMDVYPLIHGKLCTNTTEGDEVKDPIWQRFGSIARECGMEWAGDWVTFPEAPHVQMPQWRTRI